MALFGIGKKDDGGDKKGKGNGKGKDEGFELSDIGKRVDLGGTPANDSGEKKGGDTLNVIEIPEKERKRLEQQLKKSAEAAAQSQAERQAKIKTAVESAQKIRREEIAKLPADDKDAHRAKQAEIVTLLAPFEKDDIDDAKLAFSFKREYAMALHKSGHAVQAVKHLIKLSTDPLCTDEKAASSYFAAGFKTLIAVSRNIKKGETGSAVRAIKAMKDMIDLDVANALQTYADKVENLEPDVKIMVLQFAAFGFINRTQPEDAREAAETAMGINPKDIRARMAMALVILSDGNTLNMEAADVAKLRATYDPAKKEKTPNDAVTLSMALQIKDGYELIEQFSVGQPAARIRAKPRPQTKPTTPKDEGGANKQAIFETAADGQGDIEVVTDGPKQQISTAPNPDATTGDNTGNGQDQQAGDQPAGDQPK